MYYNSKKDKFYYRSAKKEKKNCPAVSFSKASGF
jgi:hypothetical protein